MKSWQNKSDKLSSGVLEIRPLILNLAYTGFFFPSLSELFQGKKELSKHFLDWNIDLLSLR